MEVRFTPDSDQEKISDADVYDVKEYLGPHLILPRAERGGEGALYAWKQGAGECKARKSAAKA